MGKQVSNPYSAHEKFPGNLVNILETEEYERELDESEIDEGDLGEKEY